MTNRKITKQDLLSICLGCSDCPGYLWKAYDGSILYRTGNEWYILLSRDHRFHVPYTFIKSIVIRSTRITTAEELKKAMRHDYYLYDV
jgi:hypothetical protein